MLKKILKCHLKNVVFIYFMSLTKNHPVAIGAGHNRVILFTQSIIGNI